MLTRPPFLHFSGLRQFVRNSMGMQVGPSVRGFDMDNSSAENAAVIRYTGRISLHARVIYRTGFIVAAVLQSCSRPCSRPLDKRLATKGMLVDKTCQIDDSEIDPSMFRSRYRAGSGRRAPTRPEALPDPTARFGIRSIRRPSGISPPCAGSPAAICSSVLGAKSRWAWR